MKLGEVRGRSPRDIAEIREYRRAEVRLLYASGYWDGPLDGLAELENERVWYCFAEESEDEVEQGWFRRYWLVKLTAEQLEEEDARHGSFTKHVGSHFDFAPEGQRKTQELRPKEEWHKHYDCFPAEEAAPSHLDESSVIGWFQL